jgi:hypothetical protein
MMGARLRGLIPATAPLAFYRYVMLNLFQHPLFHLEGRSGEAVDAETSSA